MGFDRVGYQYFNSWKYIPQLGPGETRPSIFDCAARCGGTPFPRWAHGHSLTCSHRGGCTVATQSCGECYRCMEWVCVCWCIGAGPNQATYAALLATSVLYFPFVQRYGLRRQRPSPDVPSVPSPSVCIRRGHGAPGGGLHRRHGASPPSHSFYPPAAWW